MNKKFSIIIPVYNVERYLRECLDSVLTQTFSDWEAVCVNDGSTDGSAAILDEYAAKDKRIKIITQKNSGLSEGGRLVHLIIDGLRIKEHSTHFNFLQAMEAAGKIGGEHIWLTHLTHNSSHEETAAYIAEHKSDFPGLAAAKSILPAYDGLVISTND